MAKKEKKKIMSKSIAQFAHTIGDFIKTANTQLADMLYISADEKKKNSSYRNDFTVCGKQELQQLIQDKDINIPEIYQDYGCFIYNERENKILPFKKNDYLMHDHGYFTCDGKDYSSHDDNGNQLCNSRT